MWSSCFSKVWKRLTSGVPSANKTQSKQSSLYTQQRCTCIILWLQHIRHVQNGAYVFHSSSDVKLNWQKYYNLSINWSINTEERCWISINWFSWCISKGFERWNNDGQQKHFQPRPYTAGNSQRKKIKILYVFVSFSLHLQTGFGWTDLYHSDVPSRNGEGTGREREIRTKV